MCSRRKIAFLVQEELTKVLDQGINKDELLRIIDAMDRDQDGVLSAGELLFYIWNSVRAVK